MPSVPVPFPCAVYVRGPTPGLFEFSHQCEQRAPKAFPASLRTSELRAHEPRPNWQALQAAPFLVLVAGDTAQAVSLATQGKARTPFLYHGSAYARRRPSDALLSELSEHYVALHFHGTMAVFDAACRFRAVVPIESGVSLFPRQIREADVPLLARWVEACLQRSCASSVWVTDGGDSYNELTRACSPRVHGVRRARGWVC
jgi:hypothetical protein